ncbi:MAG: PaaI family thioesterase [Pseudomonadota bacterium]
MDIAMDVVALERFLATDFPQADGMFRVLEVTPDGVRVALQPAQAHLRPGGTVSGPTMFALADVGFYLAILSRIGPEALTVTTSCSIDFMRKPPAGAELVCTSRLLKLGRVLAVGDALIEAAGVTGPVARASLTYSIPPKRNT